MSGRRPSLPPDRKGRSPGFVRSPQAAQAAGPRRLEEEGEEGAGVEAPTILLAEDDPVSAGILLHLLEKAGLRVLHYPDGAEALEGALAHPIDLAILDVRMPGMNGFELLERLRKVPAFAELPIMMLTSLGHEEDITMGFDLGADDYLVKPCSPEEVLARVRHFLGG